ncbi:hypothetical protein FYK55_27075 [Roseiconus nitratireducens]|uniref:Uncharacterized protein n=1 Tax=Roseiconus nitratireducens TaxID=2605748 RepID=A0A5M6CTS0_9BACT|nr:hypothetical protein [Roseiconus nitratireducens]KAA5538647.1 hypothetical protein FYK55_27075 [Roseiconus nitratireducens]
MTWFEDITGIDEESPEQVRRELSVDHDCIVCPNGSRIAFGRLETPNLAELRSAVASLDAPRGQARVREVVGDVRHLHSDPDNANALFQVASQFNLLEMAGPSVTPERGVGIYEHDHTQGPTCAIACGAGTIYRNYFAPVVDTDGQSIIGQSAHRQIDCSADLGKSLGNSNGKLWSMENGYLFPTDQGLEQITTRLQLASETELDELRSELRIGLQWNAEVTLPNAGHRVSQAYCSGLPVAYGRQPCEAWTDFAKLILDSAYEATICAAILNASRTGVKTVFLTLLGGGVFGNRDEWITAAIERAVVKFRDHDLDIGIVSYGRSKPEVADLVTRCSG